jgi:hypothetical protein
MRGTTEEDHMQISGATRSTVAAMGVAAAVVAALFTTTPAQAGQSRAGTAMTGAPTVGTCSTMTAAQAGAKTDASTAVRCKKAHTAWVAGVVKLPAALDWSTASAKDLFRVVATKCAPDVLKSLGPDSWPRADNTAYDYVWFRPTKSDLAAGARWLSCTIVLEHGKKLADLPKRNPPFVPKGTHHDTIARCLTKTVLTTPCSGAHAWRATGTFTLDVAKRPAVKSLNKTATRKCLPHVDRHTFYRFTYKDPVTWAAGDHTVVCYTKTKS